MRLEAFTEKQYLSLCASFNSKLVRLEVTVGFAIKYRQGFNSKLVRLEGTNQTFRLGSRFQFQTGAIRSADAVFAFDGPYLFQFQTGSIRSSNAVMTVPSTSNTFQFQTGSIRSLSCSDAIFAVSIPNWCD